jgi:hypothetical protein
MARAGATMSVVKIDTKTASRTACKYGGLRTISE